MLAFRSLIFNVLFYVNTVFFVTLGIPTFVMPSVAIVRVAQWWARASVWLMRVTVGTRVEYRGLENIQPGGLLVASKHQSAWETFALLQFFDRPTYILKRELTWIPFFGWFLLKAGMIAINRKAGASAIGEMNRRAKTVVQSGRQLLIFPEGTRRAPGAEPAYKGGIAHLYRNLAVPCLPVAINAGVFWPRRKFLRYPGTIVVEFLEPLPRGLDRVTFERTLRERIEAASDHLLREATKSGRYTGPDGI